MSFSLGFLTNNHLSLVYMQIVFMLFILRSVIEYLMMSPKLVMQADQKLYKINIVYYISLGIKNIGENIINKNISFSELITTINMTLSFNTSSINIFSLDGLLKGTLTFSLLHLVLSYSFRYIMVKVFALLSPFAILSLALKNTSWFFKSWIKNLFSLLFIQIIISLVLIILFSTDYSSGNLLSKFIYVGGIYALIKTNSLVREFIGGISTNI